MARRSWFDTAKSGDSPEAARTHASPFSGSIERLESWQRAIADGIIEPHEVAEQKERLVALLRELEPMLDDAQHEKVTRVLEAVCTDCGTRLAGTTASTCACGTPLEPGWKFCQKCGAAAP